MVVNPREECGLCCCWCCVEDANKSRTESKGDEGRGTPERTMDEQQEWRVARRTERGVCTGGGGGVCARMGTLALMGC